MRPLIYQSIIAIICITLVLCTNPEEADIEDVIFLESYEHSSTELNLISIINTYRMDNNLIPLDYIEHISFLCMEHNEYMIETNHIGHDNFSYRQMNLHQNLGALAVGENVAFNYINNQNALNAWINSPPHKVTILGNYTHIGISIRTNSQNQKYYTTIFIRKD